MVTRRAQSMRCLGRYAVQRSDDTKILNPRHLKCTPTSLSYVGSMNAKVDRGFITARRGSEATVSVYYTTSRKIPYGPGMTPPSMKSL